MKCACGSGLFSSVAVVVGLVAVGFGGYNWATTGCPLGTCRQDATAAASTQQVPTVTPASTTRVSPVEAPKDSAKDACCQGKPDGCAKEGCTKDQAACEHHETAQAPKAPQG